MCLKWWSKNHRGKKTVCHLRKVKYLKNHREQSDCTSMITTRICQKQTQILFSIFNLLMDFLASDSVKLRQYVPDCSYWRHVNLFFSFVMSYMPFTTPSLKMRKLICKEVNWQLWNFILSYHDLNWTSHILCIHEHNPSIFLNAVYWKNVNLLFFFWSEIQIIYWSDTNNGGMNLKITHLKFHLVIFQVAWFLQKISCVHWIGFTPKLPIASI